MSRPVRRALVVAAVAALAASIVAPARATAPGRDGRIAYVDDGGSGHFQLFTVRPDGSGRRQLTHLPASRNAYFPDWSPDGRRIAFTIDEGPSSQIYVIGGAGGPAIRLTHGPARSSTQPRFSPDGRQIVFQRSAAGGVCDIEVSDNSKFCHLWVMRADGSGARPLTVNARWNEFDPEWSPDGRRIAFDSDRGGLISALWVMNADGSGAHRITAPNREACWPSWSPDGAWLAFQRCGPFRSSLYAVHPDGSGYHVIRAAPAGTSYVFPSWSPSGDRIAVALIDGAFGPARQILTVAADGTGPRTAVAGLHDSIPFLDFGPAR